MSSEVNLEVCLYDKSQVCPVCSSDFKSRAVKKGKTRFVQLDLGLRSTYTPIMLDYYSVIICDKCGYAGVEKNFNFLTSRQKKSIQENVNKNYVQPKYPSMYNAEIAIDRLKKALYFSYIKNGDSSEKGYICYKIAGIAQDLKNEQLQQEYLEQAYKWYQEAHLKERYPMMGMEEDQVLYITAYLAYKMGKRDEAKKILGKLVIKKTLSYTLKEKIQDFIFLIKDEEKEENKEI